MVKLLIFIFALLSLYSCKEQTDNSPSGQNYSFTIIHNKIVDKQFTIIQQYDNTGLNINGVRKYDVNRIEKGNKSIINFTSEKPNKILVGFNEILLLPSNSPVLRYTILSKTPIFKDSLIIETGKIVLFTEYLNNLTKENSDFSLDEIPKLTFSRIEKNANRAIKNINIERFSKTEKDLLKPYIRTHFINMAFINKVLQIKKNYSKLSKESQLKVSNSLVNIYNIISKNEIQKDYRFWFGSKLYFNSIINHLSREKKLNIIEKIDDIENKEFFYVLYAKDAEALGNSDDVSYISKKISINNFKSVLNSSEISTSRLDSIFIKDVNLNHISFSKLLKNVDQDMIYFDFSGTWCKPCVEDLTLYSKNKKFDESKKIKPIWIFFENNERDWLKLINKLKLKKENCFLVLKPESQKLTEYFAKKYNWQGEFPHYFLFRKDGKIINSSEKSLNHIDK